MGLLKRMQEEYDDRGYGENAKLVCADCSGDDNCLHEFVYNNGNKTMCDFCYKIGACVTVDKLCDEIMSGIQFEYEEAVNCMGFDSQEGGYIGTDTLDTCDLLDELNNDISFDSDLLDEIKHTIKDTIWCKKDPYALSESEERLSMWGRFCSQVKTKTRYVFFRMPMVNQDGTESEFSILDHIGKDIKNLDLINELPIGNPFFRGRMHDEHTRYTIAGDMSSPPTDRAKSNRMSAEGISVFYGASNTETAIAEIFHSEYSYATVACFRNIHKLTVLDLTKIDGIAFPSLFDRDKRNLREPLLFLRSLNKHLIRPIETMKNIEYIPIQVVAEYFRHLYKYKNKAVDGISYQSSKRNGNGCGRCYVLFFDHTQCLEHSVQKLKMDCCSLKTYKVSADVDIEEIA